MQMQPIFRLYSRLYLVYFTKIQFKSSKISFYIMIQILSLRFFSWNRNRYVVQRCKRGEKRSPRSNINHDSCGFFASLRKIQERKDLSVAESVKGRYLSRGRNTGKIHTNHLMQRVSLTSGRTAEEHKANAILQLHRARALPPAHPWLRAGERLRGMSAIPREYLNFVSFPRRYSFIHAPPALSLVGN